MRERYTNVYDVLDENQVNEQVNELKNDTNGEVSIVTAIALVLVGSNPLFNHPVLVYENNIGGVIAFMASVIFSLTYMAKTHIHGLH